jgi:hypothetical protein
VAFLHHVIAAASVKAWASRAPVSIEVRASHTVGCMRLSQWSTGTPSLRTRTTAPATVNIKAKHHEEKPQMGNRKRMPVRQGLLGPFLSAMGVAVGSSAGGSMGEFRAELSWRRGAVNGVSLSS